VYSRSDRQIIKLLASGGGATRPLTRDGGVEELHGDPTVGPRPKVWTRGQKWKKYSAEDGVPERL